MVEQKRLISPRRVREMTSLSERHLKRLADEGKFPRPVQLGEAGRNSPIAYVEDEVLSWNLERIAKRDAAAAAAQDGLASKITQRARPPPR